MDTNVMSVAAGGTEYYTPQIGASGTAAAAVPWVKAGGSILGLILQGYGLYKQIQDAKAQRKLMTKWRDEDIARDNERYQTDLAMTKDKLLWNKRQTQKQWKWAEEERGYNRSMNMIDQLSGLMAQQPVLEDRLMNIWRR